MFGIEQALRRIEGKVDRILAAQDDIDQVTTAIEGEVTELGTEDAAIATAQAELIAQIAALGTTVDTTKLVAAAADLLTAQGVDATTVAALTAAAAPPAS